MIRPLMTLMLACVSVSPAFAETVRLTADRDVTLIEDAEGDVANGAGPVLFAGHTNQAVFGVRRALLHFDVASALPRDAIIDRVSVRLYQDSQNFEAVAVGLHRVLADWGEGESSIRGGRGAPAEPGDATWIFSFYDHRRWRPQGGQYAGLASNHIPVAGNGYYTWQSSAGLVEDVQQWLQSPRRNFGWLLKGNETTPQTVKRFASREAGDIGQRPVLTIDYHAPQREQ